MHLCCVYPRDIILSRKLSYPASAVEILAIGQHEITKAFKEDPHLSNISVRSSSPCFGTSRLVSCRASFRLRTRESTPNTYTFAKRRCAWMRRQGQPPSNVCLTCRYIDMRTDDKIIID